MKKPIIIIGSIVGAFIFMGIGAATGSSPESETPAAVVTVTPAPVETQAETATTATPQVCLDALDEAEIVFMASAEGFGLFATFAGLSADAVEAAAMWDVDTMDRLTVDIGGVAEDLGVQSDIVASSNFASLAASCRAGA